MEQGWMLLAAEELNMALSQREVRLPTRARTAQPQQGTKQPSDERRGDRPAGRTAAASEQTLLGHSPRRSRRAGCKPGGQVGGDLGAARPSPTPRERDKLSNQVPGEGKHQVGDGRPARTALRRLGPNMFRPYLKKGVPPTKPVSEYTLVGKRGADRHPKSSPARRPIVAKFGCWMMHVPKWCCRDGQRVT